MGTGTKGTVPGADDILGVVGEEDALMGTGTLGTGTGVGTEDAAEGALVDVEEGSVLVGAMRWRRTKGTADP